RFGQSNLALMYQEGEGVPKDAAQAAFWYRKAAEQGYATAQASLGGMYQEGKGVPKDAGKAAFWYRKAAEQGDPFGQVLLGFMYSDGEGVPKDVVMAYLWHNLAAAQGNRSAKNAREAVEKLMTREQIAEAQRLTREWKSKK